MSQKRQPPSERLKSFAPGDRVGSYEVLVALGAGGMGEVYRAYDSTLGREVAIKVLTGQSADDPGRLGRFDREGRILASLNHPNIATIHGVVESPSGPALILELVEGHVDILFANEAEICSLYKVTDFDAALRQVRHHCAVAALTRSERGSVVVAGDDVHVVAAAPVRAVVDTTGAGDLYAAGFMIGLSRGLDLPTCGRLGSLAAGEVISHVGARPQTPLVQLGSSLLS